VYVFLVLAFFSLCFVCVFCVCLFCFLRAVIRALWPFCPGTLVFNCLILFVLLVICDRLYSQINDDDDDDDTLFISFDVTHCF